MKHLANILPFFFFTHLGGKVVAIRLENRSHHMISCVIPVHQMTSGVEEIHSEEHGEGRINQLFTMRNITEPCSKRQWKKNVQYAFDGTDSDPEDP